MGPRRRRRSGRGLDVRIELAALALGDPDADQGAREVVLTCQGVEGRPGRVLLHDLLLERETVDAMTSHGLTPARPSSWSVVGSPPVRLEGRTPVIVQILDWFGLIAVVG